LSNNKITRRLNERNFYRKAAMYAAWHMFVCSGREAVRYTFVWKDCQQATIATQLDNMGRIYAVYIVAACTSSYI